jgi:hypothetical protein
VLHGKNTDHKTERKNMKTFVKYVIIVHIVLAAVLGIVWLYASGEHFMRVSLICYGFLLGYLAAWFHIGRRQGFRKFSRLLADDFGVQERSAT